MAANSHIFQSGFRNWSVVSEDEFEVQGMKHTPECRSQLQSKDVRVKVKA